MAQLLLWSPNSQAKGSVIRHIAQLINAQSDSTFRSRETSGKYVRKCICNPVFKIFTLLIGGRLKFFKPRSLCQTRFSFQISNKMILFTEAINKLDMDVGPDKLMSATTRLNCFSFNKNIVVYLQRTYRLYLRKHAFLII